MDALIITLIMLAVLLVVGMLEKFYRLTPVSELRRRANKGDGRAGLLHEVARNGDLARGYLLALALLIFALLISYEAVRLSMLQLFLFVLLIFILWGIGRMYSRMIESLAVFFAPRFAYLIVATKPYARFIRRVAAKIFPLKNQATLYEKDDLIALIEKQKQATGTRIEKSELDLALHALTFSGKVVKDYMTPRKVVRFVKSDEPVSPILMDELYQTGFSRFPVYLDEVDNIIGTLYLRDLVDRKMSGKVFSAMSSDVYEVLETENLEAVLQKILKTKHHLFIVKNEFSEVVGIITTEDIIEQILGRRIVDEFDLHEDMRAFARGSAKDHKPGV